MSARDEALGLLDEADQLGWSLEAIEALMLPGDLSVADRDNIAGLLGWLCRHQSALLARLRESLRSESAA